MKSWTWVGVIGAVFLLGSLVAALAKDPSPPKKSPELLAQGKRIFEQVCAPCHGSKGDGKGRAGATLQPRPRDFRKPLKDWPNTKGDLDKIYEVITKGIPNSAMVAWAQYSNQERWALAYTVREFAAKPAPAKKRK